VIATRRLIDFLPQTPPAAGAAVYFADEAGIRSDCHAGTTWAPVGRTPIVKATGARHSLNMISAVTAQGLLRFATYTGSFTAATFLDFCRRLLHDTDGPVHLVVDGLVRGFFSGPDLLVHHRLIKVD
jgi:DDE superfamily endonuclease